MIIIIMLHLIFVDFHTSNFPCLIIGGGEGEGGLIAGSNWGSNPLAGLQSILKIIVLKSVICLKRHKTSFHLTIRSSDPHLNFPKPWLQRRIFYHSHLSWCCFQIVTSYGREILQKDSPLFP